MVKIKEGDIAYFNEDGYVIEGKVINLQMKKDGTYTFSIEGYSDCCAGSHEFTSLMIGYTVFIKEGDTNEG